MRILQVHTRYREPGGEDIVARAEAELLTRAGHEVILHVAENPSGVVPTAASLAVSAWNPAAALACGRPYDGRGLMLRMCTIPGMRCRPPPSP
jgi:hypothetical protein